MNAMRHQLRGSIPRPLRLCNTTTSSAKPQRTASVQKFRFMSSMGNPLNRPSPPPLPRGEQREFEELVRKAQAPLSQGSVGRAEAEAELAMHPDARAPLAADFEGDVNPATGEQGGPKREPVGKWADGDWSFKGRVSDF